MEWSGAEEQSKVGRRLSRCQRGNSAQVVVAVALEKQDFSSSHLIQHPEHDGMWTASQKSAGDSTFCMRREERRR